MRPFFRKICFFLALFLLSGVSTGVEAQSGSKYFLPILMFHYVSTPPASDTFGRNLYYSVASFKKLAAFLVKHQIVALTMSDLGAGAIPKNPVMLTFDDGYEDFYTRAFPVIKKYHLRATLFVITGKLDKPSYLTTAQLKEISDSGVVEIGSHTVTHPDLTTLSNAALAQELTDSKRALETMTGKPVVSFCYPLGKTNARVQKAVAVAGYLFARTTSHGFFIDFKDPLALPTVRMLPEVGGKSFKNWWGVTGGR
ncbi:polysaccharide deacetylase family protein [Candidatus Peregrinibacteria bacterium]|nr:polysaccharide deacetylase family protein [Candidatus Peregrinibacteria bacterium]